MTTGLTRFFEWWGRGLRNAVPTPVRRMFRRRVPALAIRGEEPAVAEMRRGRRTRDLGPLDALPAHRIKRFRSEARRGRLEIVLAIPDAWAVTRPSRLPVAAEADLDQVLGYELDRLTPFAPDEIYYAGEVTGRDETRGMIDVALTYTARDRVDPLLHHIRTAGLPATRVSLLSANGTLADSNLLPSAKASTWTPGRRLAAGLMVTAIVLTALVWFNALSERTEKIAALEADLTQIRKQLIAAEDAAKPTGRPGFALAAHQVKSAAPSVLSVLAQLTYLLPDDTSLSGLEIEGADILLTGLAEEPAALIAILTDAPGFADPVFAAPITRASEVGKSRFVLAARLVERLTP